MPEIEKKKKKEKGISDLTMQLIGFSPLIIFGAVILFCYLLLWFASCLDNPSCNPFTESQTSTIVHWLKILDSKWK